MADRLGELKAKYQSVTNFIQQQPNTQLQNVNRPLLALAIGSGSLFLSHVNDAGFWLVKEYFGMTVGETFKTWSAMETIISVVSIVLILLLGVVV